MSGAETARRRVVQRRIGGAKSAAPKRRRRNGPPPLVSDSCTSDHCCFSVLPVWLRLFCLKFSSKIGLKRSSLYPRFIPRKKVPYLCAAFVKHFRKNFSPEFLVGNFGRISWCFGTGHSRTHREIFSKPC